MKTSYLVLLAALLVVFVSCNRDKYTTEPQIKIKSISPEDVIQGNLIQVKGSFTDDEGDLDSAFIVQKYYNGNTPTRIDTFKSYTVTELGLPEKTREGDFTITFAYGVFVDPYVQLPNSPVVKDTTAAFGLILKDKAGNRSNYEESDKIRLKKP